MPNYVYKCDYCSDADDNTVTEERIVSIADRDNQSCNVCLRQLVRKISFTGSVWSPTASGANHR